jgi:hypothetical protein
LNSELVTLPPSNLTVIPENLLFGDTPAFVNNMFDEPGGGAFEEVPELANLMNCRTVGQ